MRRGQRLVGLLWRWHRRTGVAIFVFLIVLAATGVVLNHSTDLELDRQFVEADWLTGLYNEGQQYLPAYQLGERWLSRSASGHLYVDTTEVATCLGELVGAVAADGMLVAACTEELLLVTADGELIESVNASTGLPVPVVGLGRSQDSVALRSDERWWTVDLDLLEFKRQPGGAQILQLSPGQLPDAIRQAIPAPEQWLTWERLLLDLHSGRIGGRAGVWLVDAVGVLLICIAFSGLTMWAFHHRRRSRARSESQQ
ncbi:MAG: hypothetical protein HKN19_12090 [Halioglobus sp.]|nr:hypothetical protein [Halioglobus sp.]